VTIPPTGCFWPDQAAGFSFASDVGDVPKKRLNSAGIASMLKLENNLSPLALAQLHPIRDLINRSIAPLAIVRLCIDDTNIDAR
jgi:hypothetical protein